MQPFNTIAPDHGRIADRPALRDRRDDMISELINHNLAMRLQLAMLRPELATMPGPDLQKLCAPQ